MGEPSPSADPSSPEFPRIVGRLTWGAFSAAAIALLLVTVLAFGALQLEDAVRSYVRGESLWSKAQKEAVIALQEYARTGEEEAWRRYRQAIKVSLGDRQARWALQADPPDLTRARAGFRQGGLEADEIGGMMRLFRWFDEWGPMRRSIRIWTQADSLIGELRGEARRVRQSRQTTPPDRAALSTALQRLERLNADLARKERAFTATIDAAADQARSWSVAAIAGLTGLLIIGGGGLSWRLHRHLQEREEVLRQSEERYRTLFQLSHDAIFVFGPEGTIQEVNERASEFVQLPTKELEGSTVVDLHPPEGRAEARSALEETKREGGGRFELIFRRSDGERRHGEVSTRQIQLEDAPLYQAVVRDVTEQREQERRLRESERRYRELFENNVAGVFRTRPDGTIEECNPAFVDLFGYDSPEELEGTNVQSFYPSSEARERYISRLREAGKLVNEELRLQRRDGSPVWVLENSFLTEDPESGKLVNEGTLVDITEQVENRQALRRAKEKFKGIFDISPVALAIQDPDTEEFLEVNPAFEDLLDLGKEEVLGRRGLSDLWVDLDRRDELFQRVQAGETVRNEEVRFRRNEDGTLHLLMSLAERTIGADRYLVAAAQDITERKKMEQRLEKMAYRDPLTGLPNRRMLEEQAGRMFALADRQEQYAGFAYIDLDGFKDVNDRWGHTVGDQVLREVGRRLRQRSRDTDLVARVGGDEFVVLLVHLDSPEEVLTASRRLTATLDVPVETAGHSIELTVSAGVAVYPEDATDLETLLRFADRALYRAKTAGLARYRPTVDVGRVASTDFDDAVQMALKGGELLLHYQPIVRLSGRKPAGVEALVRWKHPERGLLAAADFIPQAEQTGVVRRIDEYVLEQAVRQLADWQAGEGTPREVAVNLSAASFRDTAVLRQLSSALQGKQAPDPGGLVIEITETEAMQDPAVTLELLRAFRDTGIRIALDDFGTGYSSLSYLDRFPVDRVKLDRQFTSKLGGEAEEDRLVEAMLALADRLGLETVAEGVEETRQLKWLASAGCDLAQGYALARPAPAGQIVDYSDEWGPVG